MFEKLLYEKYLREFVIMQQQGRFADINYNEEIVDKYLKQFATIWSNYPDIRRGVFDPYNFVFTRGTVSSKFSELILIKCVGTVSELTEMKRYINDIYNEISDQLINLGYNSLKEFSMGYNNYKTALNVLIKVNQSNPELKTINNDIRYAVETLNVIFKEAKQGCHSVAASYV